MTTPTRTVLTDEQIDVLALHAGSYQDFARRVEAATLAASTSADPLIPLSAALAAVPPGSWCDPQMVADDLRAIPAAPQADAADAHDAARYRWLRRHTRGTRDTRGRQEFELPDPHPIGNIMQGSVAQHLDAAIDAARYSKKGGAALSAPTEPAKGDAL